MLKCSEGTHIYFRAFLIHVVEHGRGAKHPRMTGRAMTDRMRKPFVERPTSRSSNVQPSGGMSYFTPRMPGYRASLGVFHRHTKCADEKHARRSTCPVAHIGLLLAFDKGTSHSVYRSTLPPVIHASDDATSMIFHNKSVMAVPSTTPWRPTECRDMTGCVPA